ncbi:MAG: nucleotidyltransferase domain-containing protein [Anaerolineae bacterium]|nr:nucleotidyltransferase domain-containing protein [Anaerolineae bacterium]MCX8068744.1 nucleotidyltransferase domain-containing protein [Anaerolineae bacterium]MDW7992315.1 nucleotidyltransferase domain-containing protein [Anaerolineae bacterium]
MGGWSPEEIALARENLQRRREAEYRAREERRQRALQALREAASRVFPRFATVQRAYLFGSVIYPGQMGLASDVDVAVEGNLSPEDYFALWRALEEASGETIDLVELNEDVPFARRVRESGEVIYERRNPGSESGD